MSDWDFGGAFADTAGKLQEQDQARQLFPAKLEHEKSLTRLDNAQSDVMEQKLASSRKMAESMQRMSFGGEGETLSTALVKMGGAAMEAGDPTLAGSILTHAAAAQTGEARQAYLKLQESKIQMERTAKLAARYAALIRGANVNSQVGLNQVNQMFEQETGEKAPQMEYSPQNIHTLLQSAISVKDQAYIDHARQVERLAAARLGETRTYHNEVLDIRRKAEERRRTAAETKEKNGGKDVGDPSEKSVEHASDLLDREGDLKGLDKTTQDTAAFDLAARARTLRQQNKGLDPGEAMARARIQMKAEGYFTKQKAAGLFGTGIGASERTLYGKPGASVNKPLPLPADAAQRKENTYYITPKSPKNPSGVALYLGGGKWMAAGDTPEAAIPPEGDDEEKDDDMDDEE